MSKRCRWCTSDPLYIAYHDEEWGVPVHDDTHLFEMLILEGAQAGLSWFTILKKRENYRRAYEGFRPEIVAKFGARKVAALLKDASIVRNRAKVAASIGNARATLQIQSEFGSLDAYLWSFVQGRPMSKPLEGHSPGPHAYARVGRDEQGAARPRLQIRRHHHLPFVHAGGWHGERSRSQLPAPRRGPEARPR